MQPRSLQQILTELDSTGPYNQQIDNLRQRQSGIPQALQAEEQGLAAKQTQAFDDIVGGARRRGLGFSGIPVGEQAKYNATEYMPALARLKQQGRDQAMSLEDAILGIQERRMGAATDMFDRERNFYEQRRQFDESARMQREQQAASASGGFNPTYGGMSKPQNNPKSATIQQRPDKGFNFTAPNGQPISAASYAAMKGIPFRELLAQMAKAGDAGAKQALGFVGDDFGFDKTKLSKATQGLYNSLVWGSGGLLKAKGL